MKKEITKIISDAIKKLQKNQKLADFVIPEIAVEYAKNEKYGDYATNAAMVLGKLVKKNPLEIAEIIKQEINNELFEKVEVAALGYINFYLSKKYLQNKIAEINERKEKFGNSEIGKGKKINNEFISANPTGPLHLGNGRGGFYGDSIGRVCRKAGFEVWNEYYVNDFGEQVVKLGHSVLKDDEAVYVGEYIEELHKKLKNLSDIKEIGEKSAEIILDSIIKKTVAEKMHIGVNEILDRISFTRLLIVFNY